MLNFKYNMTNIIPLFSVVFILLAISSPFYFLALSQIINRLKTIIHKSMKNG